MKILIEVHPNLDLYSLQMYDWVYAYWQYLKTKNKTKIKHLDICFTDCDSNLEIADRKVLHAYLPHYLIDNKHNYDLIIFDNADEPVSTIITNEMKQMLENYDNTYCICNSYTTKDYFLYNKIITLFGDWPNTLTYWTGSSYYHSFFNSNINDNKNSVVFINGANRAHRQYFTELISPDIPIYSSTIFNSSDIVPEFNEEKQILIEEDIKFNTFLHNRYSAKSKSAGLVYKYYDLGEEFPAGINGKFGSVPPGYEILDTYFEYYCIAYPETSYKNNELSLTEKGLKCFMSGSIPFPVGGANINALYNELGFFTAHDLLPNKLKFDHITDHVLRYKKSSIALKWLNKHVDIFKTDKARHIIENNKKVYYQRLPIQNEIKKLYKLLTNENI